MLNTANSMFIDTDLIKESYVYQTWEGANKLFCKGKIFAGYF